MVLDWISQITLPGDLCNVNESGGIFGARSLSVFIKVETEVEQQHYLNCCGYEEIWKW